MLSIAPLLILTVEVVLGQGNRMAVKEQIYPLDMANKSVDDKYDDCRKETSDLVYTSLLKNEIDENPTYKDAWEEGKTYAKTPADNLTMNHSIAIYVYTARKVYADFNNAGRSGKHNYKRRLYKWRSLQFLLTEVIQILNETQNQCHLTYRRTKVEFDKDVLNKEVRFGSFTSSSLNETAIKNFGNVSCFEIETCEGAYVANYSAHAEEEEVLIPPYEKFNVTDIKNNSWCKTVYVLKSLGTKSDLNCIVAKHTPINFVSNIRSKPNGCCKFGGPVGLPGGDDHGSGTDRAGPDGLHGPRAQ
ncbi:NAD(P)(+)--arginine ADP-ribosyltransferase 2-like isoform X2 [Xyrauchen texanus]|uniref:NAD(P)(+)--arginine ADP-ribosyltransferase 2-like isoform X1 n=1 Tax=Xyrauchen texanus TaxID=154827 RepID=UPI002241CAE3|nr:NAD(P)(+)--arginine ADP-ribosyltransferase 2-like isoform X1 [Xyrauchen texanus]XP_051987630.1 NAD(P)(+)--arginine ADP-ribosyltransferase 2-like isoform X2 [Xyrauchen texanus]